jgi:hypothetical protein
MTEKYDELALYDSKYSGGFALMNSWTSRPCATNSFKLDSLSYYRGQNTLAYNLFETSETQAANALLNMENPTLTYENGKNASDLVVLGEPRWTTYIQTDDESLVGVQKFIMRECDSFDRFIEQTLTVEVL